MNAEQAPQQQPGRIYGELETLIDIGKALTSHLSLKDIYQVVMQKVSNLLCPQAWSLLIADEQTGELSFEIVVSPAAEKLRAIRLQPGEGVAGWVVENGTPVLIPDATKDRRFARRIDRRIGFTTHSLVCVPLVSSHQTIGAIELVNGLGKEEYSEQDQRILSTIAEFTAIAIENSRLMQRISDLTIIDDLTGLYNSHHFQTICEYEMERARRFDNDLSLVFLDLDHFKRINDTYGHLTGSRLLREVGALFRRDIRKIDSAARYGGDEFVFLLPATDREGALIMATKLLNALRQSSFLSDSGQPIKMTASIGVASYPAHADNLEKLMERADEAMYRVKRGDRNAVLSA